MRQLLTIHVCLKRIHLNVGLQIQTHICHLGKNYILELSVALNASDYYQSPTIIFSAYL